MKSAAATPQEYLASLPEDRKSMVDQLRKTIIQHLPKGFEETMSYGMITFVVPHSMYPSGYHVNSKQALPFISIGSQKNFIALHHMGIYADKDLLSWFVKEYDKRSKTKLDMGKGCIRFKKPEQIPLQLIGELATKITPRDWVTMYEKHFKK